MDHVENVPVGEITGKCSVVPDDASLRGDFVCTQRLPRNSSPSLRNLVPLQRALKTCVRCSAERTAKDDQGLGFVIAPKLPAVDLYSGGGGSVLGASEHFNVKLALDHSAVACETLRCGMLRVG